MLALVLWYGREASIGNINGFLFDLSDFCSVMRFVIRELLYPMGTWQPEGSLSSRYLY